MLVAQQLLAEARGVDAQVVVEDEALGQAGVGRHLMGDRRLVRVGQILALGERKGVGTPRPLPHFVKEGGGVGWGRADPIVIGRRRREARHVIDQLLIEARIAPAVVQDRGQQDHAVELGAVALQAVGEAG